MATLDKAITDKKAELDTLNKAKSEASSVISIGKQKGISEDAVAGVVEAVGQGTPKKGQGCPSKGLGGSFWACGRTRPENPCGQDSQNQCPQEGRLSNYAIAKKLGITPKTAAKY